MSRRSSSGRFASAVAAANIASSTASPSSTSSRSVGRPRVHNARDDVAASRRQTLSVALSSASASSPAPAPRAASSLPDFSKHEVQMALFEHTLAVNAQPDGSSSSSSSSSSTSSSSASSTPTGTSLIEGANSAYEALTAMVRATGARRAPKATSSKRSEFAEADASERAAAFHEFVTECPTGNFVDFLDEVYGGDNPHFSWTQDAGQISAPTDVGDDDVQEQDDSSACKRARVDTASDSAAVSTSLSSSSAASTQASSSSSSSSSASTSTTTSTSVACNLTLEFYASMAKTAEDMLLRCVDPACALLRKDHRLKAKESSTAKMPSLDNFPKFRDPNDKLMSDPYEFLVRLERQLKFYDLDTARYGTVLVNCVPDRLMQDWIEQNILATCTTWDEIKRRFRQKYDDPNIKNKLIVQLQGCHQAMSARVHQYTEEYQSLVVRVSGGAPIDTFTNINQCERGFIPLIREKLASYRAEQTQRQGFGFEFKTLADLYQAAATIESGLAPLPGRFERTEQKVGRRRAAQLNNVQDGPITTEPAVNKIEMNARGQPVNVNKKNKPRASSATLSSSSNSSPAPASGGRGGFRGRGGFTRGRGGFRGGRAGRGSHGNSNTSVTSSGHTSTPAAQPRGLTQSHTPSGASNFGGECFNCHRRGHRAQDCPLQSNAQSHL